MSYWNIIVRMEQMAQCSQLLCWSFSIICRIVSRIKCKWYIVYCILTRIICNSHFENRCGVYQIQCHVSRWFYKQPGRKWKQQLADTVLEVKNVIVKISSLWKECRYTQSKALSLFNGNTRFNTMHAVTSALVSEGRLYVASTKSEYTTVGFIQILKIMYMLYWININILML